jgi:hypothetical protein
MTIVSEYDFESDTWTHHNGDTPTRGAWRAAVADIAAKAKETLPECGGRVDSAVKIVLAGDVELLADGTAKVASQSNGITKYFVVNGECSCPDFAKAPSHWCKHRIAAGLAKRVAQRVSAQGVSPATTAAQVVASGTGPTPGAVPISSLLYRAPRGLQRALAGGAQPAAARGAGNRQHGAHHRWPPRRGEVVRHRRCAPLAAPGTAPGAVPERAVSHQLASRSRPHPAVPHAWPDETEHQGQRLVLPRQTGRRQLVQKPVALTRAGHTLCPIALGEHMRCE